MNENDFDGRIDVPGGARPEDEPDLEGYDESQRAEVAEFEGRGPTDGVLMTDLMPDLGGDIDDDEIEDDEDLLDDIIDTDEQDPSVADRAS